ncbi:MAG: PaaI family thioesterase [Kofleriaceae bacterium]|nr:PaaI family thioesterase [Myxococcales bacterium]MCB9560597.1 PaaI family thioesterase [Kofleriaceae bacterium]
MRARIGEARAAGDVDRLIQAVPYARFLGLTAAIVDGRVVVTMRYGDHLIGNPTLPALHGGTLGALLESAAIFELLWSSETIVVPKTVTITVDYLRSGRPVDTYASGVVTRQGRRVANVLVDAWQEDPAQPIATAHAHFLIKRDEPDGDRG